MTVMVILGVLLYLTVAPLLAALVSRGDERPMLLWWSIIYLAMPATMCWLLLFGLLSIPYFSLYPERHAHSVDFSGNDEEKAALSEYRRQSSERSFVRRCLESCGLCADTRVSLPQSVVEFQERELTERRALDDQKRG